MNSEFAPTTSESSPRNSMSAPPGSQSAPTRSALALSGLESAPTDSESKVLKLKLHFPFSSLKHHGRPRRMVRWAVRGLERGQRRSVSVRAARGGADFLRLN